MSTIIDVTTKPENPFLVFKNWFEAAQNSPQKEPTAMTLATVSPEGQPQARTVLLKAWDERGFCFFTNYCSFKAQALDATPKAGLCMFWREIDRQVNIQGIVEKTSEKESDQYFDSRPRGSQLGGWASKQSQPLTKIDELVHRVEEFQDLYEGTDIPRPPHWGGFRVIPTVIEFWYEGQYRLHTRLRYTRETPEHDWNIQLLYP